MVYIFVMIALHWKHLQFRKSFPERQIHRCLGRLWQQRTRTKRFCNIEAMAGALFPIGTEK